MYILYKCIFRTFCIRFFPKDGPHTYILLYTNIYIHTYKCLELSAPSTIFTRKKIDNLYSFT